MDGKEGSERLTFEALDLREAGTRRKKQHEQMIQLEDFPYRDPELCDVEQTVMDFCTAVRAEIEILGAVPEEDFKEWRIVGTLWGEQSLVRADIFEIQVVATDPYFRGAAEWWLMDRLKREMPKQGWKHLAIRTSLKKPNNSLLSFASRHGFRACDIKNGKSIWEWSQKKDEGQEDQFDD